MSVMPKGAHLARTTLLVTLSAIACADGRSSIEATDLESLEDKASYGLGLEFGRNLREQDVPFNLDYLMKGIEDGVSGRRPLLAEGELHETMLAFREELETRQQNRMARLAETNRAECAQFLRSNSDRRGVVTRPSGLQYEVIGDGTGTTPGADDEVQVHYVGTLLDGTVFNTSYPMGEPATFRVSEVIPGWQEALQLMTVGSNWKLYLPAELAYGEAAPDPSIGPNACLIFEIELLSISTEH